MSSVSEILNFNFVVIAPTLVLLITALVLLFATITVPMSMKIKKGITFVGVVFTLLTTFLKFGLFLTDGISSYFSEKILLD